MLDHLLDAVLSRHTIPGETEGQVLARLRVADSRLTPLFATADVRAAEAYRDPLIRAAYLLRYLPHYTLQMGDLLRALEGDEAVSQLFAGPHLRHLALCGGPAPEPIALAVLHQQGGGQWLQTTVVDQGAAHWCDCWPISASVASSFSRHPRVEIGGLWGDLAQVPQANERAELAQTQVLTLMNALNELMRIGERTLEHSLAARLDDLPAGALVLVSDQALYNRTVEGLALFKRLLLARGARLVCARLQRAERHEIANRFQLSSRLRSVYGQGAGPSGPATRYYRVWNRSLQLAAVLP